MPITVFKKLFLALFKKASAAYLAAYPAFRIYGCHTGILRISVKKSLNNSAGYPVLPNSQR